MAAKKKGLGRGLDLLIPEGNNTKQSKTEKESKPIIKEVVKEVVKEVKVPAETFLKLSDIEPNREQPRKILTRKHWKNWLIQLSSMV